MVKKKQPKIITHETVRVRTDLVSKLNKQFVGIVPAEVIDLYLLTSTILAIQEAMYSRYGYLEEARPFEYEDEI